MLRRSHCWKLVSCPGGLIAPRRTVLLPGDISRPDRLIPENVLLLGLGNGRKLGEFYTPKGLTRIAQAFSQAPPALSERFGIDHFIRKEMVEHIEAEPKKE